MDEKQGGYSSSRFVFELEVDSIDLNVDSHVDISLLWIAGTQRSQTSESVSLLPDTTTHKVNQKLILHHKYTGGDITTFISTLQVLEAHKYVKPKVLGECQLDLASLIFQKNSESFTIPLESALDKNATISLSVNAANVVFKDSSVTSPSQTASDDLSQYHGTLPEMHLNSTTKSSNWEMINSEEIYRRINKMATKLSHIESEIQAKTRKLSKINHSNTDQMKLIKAHLENQIEQKDKQIRILTLQLDEMHTALALSHQRELEMAGQLVPGAPAPKSLGLIHEKDMDKYDGSMDSAFDRNTFLMKSSGGTSYVPQRFTSEQLKAMIGHDGKSKDYDYENNRREPSPFNGPPSLNSTNAKSYGYVVRRHLPEVEKVSSVKPLSGGLAFGAHNYNNGSSKLDGRGGGNGSTGWSTEVRGTQMGSYAASRKPARALSSRSSIRNKSAVNNPYMARGSLTVPHSSPIGQKLSMMPHHMVDEGRRDLSKDGISHGNMLTTPGTMGLHVGTTPSMLTRQQKARSITYLSHGPHMLNSRSDLNQDQSSTGRDVRVRQMNSTFMLHHAGDTSAEQRIVVLENDLIKTKVALADSETQRDIDITNIINQTKKE